MNKEVFITISSCAGVGKSTIAQIIMNALAQEGIVAKLEGENELEELNSISLESRKAALQRNKVVVNVKTVQLHRTT